MNLKYKGRTVKPGLSLLEAFKLMDALDKKLLIVLDNDIFRGLLSAGDIQRAIINNKPLTTKVGDILRKEIRIASPSDDFSMIKQMMLDFRMELCPVVNDKKEIVNVYFWEDVFLEKNAPPVTKFNIPVVIMAGGFGSRLKPLTNVLPKPLIPIGEKTIIEEIFDRFGNYGCNDFYISVNYKSELIEFYLKHQNLEVNLNFFKEDKPMGTAGSLSLLKGRINKTFFVSNCDILIEQDYAEILSYHKQQENDITVVAALKSYPIAYGTLETGEGGKLVGLTEKPELTFKINSGMYILEPHVLEDIPEGEFFHITHLIELVSQKGGNIGVFPISEKSWKDIGTWDEYKTIINEFH